MMEALNCPWPWLVNGMTQCTWKCKHKELYWWYCTWWSVITYIAHRCMTVILSDSSVSVNMFWFRVQYPYVCCIEAAALSGGSGFHSSAASSSAWQQTFKQMMDWMRWVLQDLPHFLWGRTRWRSHPARAALYLWFSVQLWWLSAEPLCRLQSRCWTTQKWHWSGHFSLSRGKRTAADVGTDLIFLRVQREYSLCYFTFQ